MLTFIYASCHATCPALVGRLQALEARQPGDARFVAVTLDPERDTPCRPRRARGALGARPALASPDGRPQRRAAASTAAHRVQVVRLADGEFAHDNVVVLLDRAGRDRLHLPRARAARGAHRGRPATPPGGARLDGARRDRRGRPTLGSRMTGSEGVSAPPAAAAALPGLSAAPDPSGALAPAPARPRGGRRQPVGARCCSTASSPRP